MLDGLIATPNEVQQNSRQAKAKAKAIQGSLRLQARNRELDTRSQNGAGRGVKEVLEFGRIAN